MTHDPEMRGSDPCPDPEVLATFLDGRLTEREREGVATHLAACESCYAVVLAASQTRAAVGEVGGPLPWYVVSRRVMWSAVAGLATAATLAIATTLGMMPWQRGPQAALQQALVAAVGTERPIEPRLTGGFAYAPIQTFRSRPAAIGDAPSPDVRIAASRIEKQTASEGSTRALHLRGIATLLVGNADLSIALLERAVEREPGNAQLQNDLATAFLVRARRTGDTADLRRALATANRAVDADRALAEARFNRAYALERLGMRDEARDAWQSYLTIDDRSGWADEARARLRALKQR